MTDEKGRKPNSFRITRVYTRGGDEGMTHLADGRRVAKDHPRLDAYGTLDELQVAIGAARDALAHAALAHAAAAASSAAASSSSAAPAPAGNALPALFGLIGEHLIYLQNMVFTVSGDLATPLESRRPGMPLARPEDVVYMETLIDALNKPLPPLRDFVLPGGHPAVTALHVCRVVGRRAEREVEALARAEAIGEPVRPVLNRLSDLFFVLARRVALELKQAGLMDEELIWRHDPAPPAVPPPPPE